MFLKFNLSDIQVKNNRIKLSFRPKVEVTQLLEKVT